MKRPAVCFWLKAYCAAMLILLGVVVALAMMMIVTPETLLKDETAFRQNPAAATMMMRTFGVFFAMIFGLPMLPLLAAIVWPRGQWAWYVGIMAIVAGFFTVIGWVATLPLLLFWNRPEVKAYYGFAVSQPSAAKMEKSNQGDGAK